ncbi:MULTISPECIES: DUF3540 domain-containing protein [Bordetella]|uniref:DUF3540 domain-containing protein n=1 Tax=Bordetella genomosp. 2 TaxID=1983456 RepID=A0A261VFL8_9BORD|nr:MULTISPECIES: DUF3540 domain-containing protein [Bordetella]OZI72561.1 hypothetical protein CAL24_19940 [Bordetella genomosp. 2]
MKTAAAKRQYPVYDPVHLIGTVTHRDEDGIFTVDCDGRTWHARQAASCLLAPREGDEVLISGPDAARVYLIAVTRQADPRQASLETAGDMVLRSHSGNVALEAAGAVRLAGRDAVQVETGAFRLQATDAHFVAEKAKYTAAEVSATVGATRLIGKTYEAVMDRLSFLSRVTFRAAEEVEHVRAGSLDYRADKSARLHASYTMVTGENLVKVDAKQIHMG